jgi:hypothetical protein
MWLLLMSTAVGAPAAVLVPFVGWIFGWPGVATVIALGFAPAYFFGAWIGHQNSIKLMRYFCAAGSAVVPLGFALWIGGKNVSDPALWAWLAMGFVTFVTVLVAARHSGNAALRSLSERSGY